MNWRDPKKELPKEGDIVWVLLQHWKQEGALSCEIYCGEVEWSNDRKCCRVENLDYIGQGSASWDLWYAEDWEHKYSRDLVDAWLPVNELNLPKWIKK